MVAVVVAEPPEELRPLTSVQLKVYGEVPPDQVKMQVATKLVSPQFAEVMVDLVAESAAGVSAGSAVSRAGTAAKRTCVLALGLRIEWFPFLRNAARKRAWRILTSVSGLPRISLRRPRLRCPRSRWPMPWSAP